MMAARLITRAGTLAVLAVLAVLINACGGGSPTQPTPPPPPTPPNQVPVIESITVSTERTEVETDVTLTATVRDAETPVAQLRFDWKADVGTFTGTGPTVTWRVPRGTATPADIIVSLTVVEVYGTADASGRRPEWSITGPAPAVRVHDSPKEIGELALRFLADFANSDVPADAAVREFTDACASEKNAEREDVADNRRYYQVLNSTLSLERASMASNRVEGEARVACEFFSRFKECPPDVSCTVGGTERVRGKCDVTTRYEQRRWWLCSSNFREGELLPSMRAFFGLKRAE